MKAQLSSEYQPYCVEVQRCNVGDENLVLWPRGAWDVPHKPVLGICTGRGDHRMLSSARHSSATDYLEHSEGQVSEITQQSPKRTAAVQQARYRHLRRWS